MPESFETLRLDRQGRVAIITINRPDKRNALKETTDFTSVESQLQPTAVLKARAAHRRGRN